MTSDLRRQLILGAAKRCFARNGFAGTTTKSVAAAAAISEGLLFKHFPSKAALYAKSSPRNARPIRNWRICSGQEPSTATLVELVRGMVDTSSTSRTVPTRKSAAPALHGGEPSRGRRVCASALRQDRRSDRSDLVTSLERAVEAGDAARSARADQLFWFAHHTVLTAA
jgi:AcrR family transcriptional regulator